MEKESLRFYYSEKQRRVTDELNASGGLLDLDGRPDRPKKIRNYCIVNGVEHEYTEAIRSESKHSSNWDDAIYLGEGYISRHVVNDVDQTERTNELRERAERMLEMLKNFRSLYGVSDEDKSRFARPHYLETSNDNYGVLNAEIIGD